MTSELSKIFPDLRGLPPETSTSAIARPAGGAVMAIARQGIVPANVLAVAALYGAAMLEDLAFFAVADKVVEQFMSGMLPLSGGASGTALVAYLKGAPGRMTEAERRAIYSRALGLGADGSAEPSPNSAFPDLLLHFALALHNFEGAKVEITPVFEAGRALARNASQHGYGMAHGAAIELRALSQQVQGMLSAPDLLAAYGVQDLWQLIERVSKLHLGTIVNTVPQRILASAGSALLQWLATHAAALDAHDLTALTSGISAGDLLENAGRWLTAAPSPLKPPSRLRPL